MTAEVSYNPAEPASVTPEHMLLVTDTVAGIAKLATLAALDKTPAEFLTSVELCRRIDELQGTRVGWSFATVSRTVPFNYCKSTLLQTGLVTLGSKESGRGTVQAAKISPLGSELWPAVAGVYLPWERDNPELSLNQVIGFSQSAFQRGSSMRLDILQFLLSHPDASVTDLKELTGTSFGSTSNTVTELCNLGLLTAETKYGPEQRRFTLDVPSDMARRYFGRMSDDVQKAINAIEALKQEGVSETSGLEIIRKIKSLYPDTDPRVAWRQMMDWMRNNRKEASALREIDVVAGEKARTRLRVAEACAGPIGELLELRAQLATNADFREDAALEGRAYFRNKRKVGEHLKNARLESQALNRRAGNEWEPIFYENVPLEGISIDGLLTAVISQTGIRITKKSLMKRVTQHEDQLRIATATTQEGVVRVPQISLKRHTFASNWINNARCRSPGVDRTLFEEQPATAAGNANTKKALQHCQECIVRHACLKTAVEDDEQEGVWGGMTGADLQKLTGVQKAAITQSVNIQQD